MAVGAAPLDPEWVLWELPFTKPGLRGQPRVLGLMRVINHDGSSFSKISLPEAAECLAPFVAARGNAETSVFLVISETTTVVAVSAIRTATFKRGRGADPRHVGLRGPPTLAPLEGTQYVPASPPRSRSARAGTRSAPSRTSIGASRSGGDVPRRWSTSSEGAVTGRGTAKGRVQVPR